MTSFEDPQGRPAPAALPQSSRLSGRKDPNKPWYSGLMHAAMKIEEIEARALGQLFTSNPDYNEVFKPSTLGTQTTFAHLITDLGVNEKNFGSYAPMVAAVAGITAAIMNPTDPINKMRIFGLTSKGFAGQAIKNAGIKNLVKTGQKVNGRAILAINKKKIESELAELVGNRKKGVYQGANARAADRSIKRHQTTLRDIDDINTSLVGLQRAGNTIQDLELAESFFAQSQRGQRKMLGFTSPFRMDQLALFGVGRSPKSQAVAYSLPTKLDAAMTGITVGAYKNTIGRLLKGGKAAMAGMGLGVTATVRAEEAARLIKQALAKFNGHNSQEVERNLESIYRSAKLTPHQLEEIIDTMETAQNVAVISYARDTLNKFALKAPNLDVLTARETAEVGKVTPGSRLTEDEMLKMTPHGLNPEDIVSALRQHDSTTYPMLPIGTNGEHKARILGEYIVIEPGTAKGRRGSLSDLDAIYGTKVWHRTSNGTLIQRKLPHAVPIGKLGRFDITHLENLENIAAQLARQSKQLTNLSPSDILVTPFGGVQIINPDVIQTARSVDQAAKNSQIALDSLADKLYIPMGPAREFHSLKNARTAEAVPKGTSAMRFRRVDATNSILEEGDEVFFMQGHDLMNQAANMGPHRDFLRAGREGMTPSDLATEIGDPRDWYRAQNIEPEAMRIRKQLAAGQNPHFKPIEITVDDWGQVHVLDGRDRLTAALMEGMDVIPILKKDFVGDVVDLSKGWHSGPAYRIGDVFHETGGEARDGFIRQTFRGENEFGTGVPLTKTDPAIELVAPNYRMITHTGEALEVTPDMLDIASAEQSFFAMTSFATSGPLYSTLKAQKRESRLRTVMEKKFGSTNKAAIVISELIEESNGHIEFATALEKLTGFSMSSARDQNISNRMADMFQKVLKPTAKKHLDDLAKQGVITNSSIDNLTRYGLASHHQGVTVQALTRDGEAVRFLNAAKTPKALRKQAEDWLHSATTPADVQPHAKIHLHGGGGMDETIEVADLVTHPHPHLRQAIINNRSFVFSKEWKEYLKREGIHVNPNEAVMKKLGLDFGVLLNRQVDKHGIMQFASPDYAYFITRSGDLLLSTKHTDVRKMLKTVFKEGPQSYQEYGVFAKGMVTVSNPFGAMMAKVGAGEVRILTRRLTSVAQRFSDLGLSHNTRMDVLAPFDRSVWEQMYGKRTTIGEVLDPKFKLKIPDLIKGHVPDYMMDAGRFMANGEAGEVAYRVTHKRIKDEKVRAIYEELVRIGDEAFVRESMADLPVSYHEGYLGRTITPEARAAFEAMNEGANRWLDTLKKGERVGNVESFFKGRTFTDLTTREINALIKELGKIGHNEPEKVVRDIVSQIIKGAKNEVGKVIEVGKSDARKLYEISKIMPSGLDFFIVDPIYATALRWRRGQSALARKAIFDDLAKKHVLWEGTIQDLYAARKGKEPYAALDVKIAEMETVIQDRTRTLDTLVAKADDVSQGEQSRLRGEIDKLMHETGELQRQRIDKFETFTRNKAAAGEVDFNAQTIHISGEDARQMLESGLVSADDILGDVANPLVRIQGSKYEIALDKAGKRVALFPEDVAKEVDRFFAATSKDGFQNFMRHYDNVLGLWKSWTLFPIPAYHARNVFSNSFMAWLGGITNPSSYKDSFRVFKVMRQHRAGKIGREQAIEALESMQFSNTAGEVMDARELYGHFVTQGGLSGGLHFNEFGRRAPGDTPMIKRPSTFEQVATDRGMVPSSVISGANFLHSGFPIRWGMSTAAGIENHFRMAAFLQTWQTTGSISEAGLTMKKIFYDYSDLNGFERDIMRRVIPFYSWSRHNIPRMLETMVTKPQIHFRMNQMVRNMEMGATDGRGVDDDGLPDWVRKNYALIFSTDKDGNYWIKTGAGLLPQVDAYRLMQGNAIGDMILNGLTPIVKTPIEQLFNYSLFKHRDIANPAMMNERSSSATLGSLGITKRPTMAGPLGAANIVLNQHLFTASFRLGNEFVSKVLDPILKGIGADPRDTGRDDSGFFVSIWSLMFGRAVLIDPEKTRRMFQATGKRQIQVLKGKRKYAIRKGDVRLAEDITRVIDTVRLQMVPK